MNINPKKILIDAITSYLMALDYTDINGIIRNIEVVLPPTSEFGDYASTLPLQLSKILMKPPLIIADEMVNKINPLLQPIFNKINIVNPGYVNFTLSKSWLQESLHKVLKYDKKWGCQANPQKKVVIEYSSPNIAKIMHVGHLRNTLIGHALDNLHHHLQYDVITDNHLGDWGTQFGKMLVAYRIWNPKNRDNTLTVKQIEQLYIRFNKEAKECPELMDQARAETVKLQSGDKDTKRQWELFCKISMAEFSHIYNQLGISFDLTNGESFYEKMLPDIVNDALTRGIAMVSEGAVIIPLDEEGLPPFLIRKRDGGFLYSTTDLATIKWRAEHINPDLVLYVVADQQELHFKQLFASAKKLGYGGHEQLVHIAYGLVLGEDGKKMSTREGETVDASALIHKSISLAKSIIQDKNTSLSPADSETIAQKIGIAALIYNDLSRDRNSSVTFNWDTMMNFKGSSAPYLLYTYVRINGIVKKTHQLYPDDFTLPADHSLLCEPEELLLLRTLVKFPETLETFAAHCRPHYLVHYLENFANIFHATYDRLSVVHADVPVRRARLSLFRGVALTMKIGMEILGMQPVEKM